MLTRTAIYLVLSSLVAVRVGAAQQPTVVIRTAGPGRPGALLQAALAAPNRMFLTPEGGAHFPRDSAYETTIIVIGADATVASRISGDVIVVGGDLFLRPGALIEGRAVAIGGGVYNSMLAVVGGERLSFRDVTFVMERTATGVELNYRDLVMTDVKAVTLPFLYGFRQPAYTRVDGVSLPWGPRISIDTGRIIVDPTVSYRSDLGEIDPWISASATAGRRWRVEAVAGRTTASNDRWMRSELANSVSTLVVGRDHRNYYRAERGGASIHRLWIRRSSELSVMVGANTERARSVLQGGPWSFRGKNDALEGMLRPNPLIAAGRINSAVAGGNGTWEAAGVSLDGDLIVEFALKAPLDRRFTQTTVDAGAKMPTFVSQTLTVRTHAVITSGNIAPPQRFAYLGGSSTLPTLNVLELGGDQLLFVESAYNIPIKRIKLPFVGSPVFTLRHMLGSAGIGDLPDLEQNVGARIRLGPLRVDYTVDPVSKETDFGVGVSISM
ncbi:MAG: hypothetical protein ABR543_00710 [Gemmatimonadaceae bacterium]